METNTDKRKTLIRRLLVEQLLPEEKQKSTEKKFGRKRDEKAMETV